MLPLATHDGSIVVWLLAALLLLLIVALVVYFVRESQEWKGRCLRQMELTQAAYQIAHENKQQAEKWYREWSKCHQSTQRTGTGSTPRPNP